ncbi:uncharacterized protein LOC120000673 [Tripterygium wilfordii]|uniref:uncharacterized protein LOC120000673 n=1 Tax=Tripterygium wilfordii TaxID=458696 RepID=UPI0018F7EA91|nr:uncharacterized protein LOC120000673 [Tripterygium wilfordii]
MLNLILWKSLFYATSIELGHHVVKTVIKNSVFIVAAHFTRLFREAQVTPIRWEGLPFKSLSYEMSNSLETPVLKEEIKEAIWNCEGSKAPGPDGFNFNFLKKSWSIIENDVCSMVHLFYTTGKLPAGVNSSFITLIPKIKGSCKLKDYRPISLVSSLYKIVSKVLATRLKKVLSLVISETQSAFCKGRQIMDSILVANEIVHRMKKRRKKGLLLKLDMEKAFDSVNWNYLDKVMLEMGFGARWRNWIRECISSAKVSVLVNGSPTKEFSMEKGIRQGDPLSPFLFNLAAEGLHQLLEKAEMSGLIKGIAVRKNGLRISHLQYADDTLIFLQAKEKYIQVAKRILRCYEVMSGLKINFHKSSLVGIGVNKVWAESLAVRYYCKYESLPVKCLGMPLGANFNLAKTWKPVLEKFQDRLASWKGRQLSVGGRLTLIKSALSNLPIYFMSLFRMPSSIARKIEQMQRNFLWGDSDEKRKIHNVSWQQVIKAKKLGGLGIGDILIKNQALLCKWLWRFLTEENALWKKVIQEKYHHRDHGLIPFPISASSPLWRNVHKCMSDTESQMGRIVNAGLKFSLGNGRKIRFWLDKWVGDVTLKEKYPRKADRVIWSYDSRGIFSVKSLYYKLQEDAFPTDGSVCYQDIWNGYCPPKVEFFVWTLLQKKINTRDKLTHLRIIQPADNICPFCSTEPESVNHVFLQCVVPKSMWYQFVSWWGLDWCPNGDISAFFQQWKGLVRGGLQEKLWTILFFVIVWSIWRERNETIFRGKSVEWNNVYLIIFVRLHHWLTILVPKFPYTSSQMLQCASTLKSCFDALKRNRREELHWLPPLSGHLKWNVDGSALGKPGPAGIGGVLRSNDGTIICLFSCPIGICESNEAEIKAIKKALEITISSGNLSQICITLETDSANGFKWIVDSGMMPWRLEQIGNAIQNAKEQIPNLSVKQIVREQNGMADILAKEAVRRNYDFISWAKLQSSSFCDSLESRLQPSRSPILSLGPGWKIEDGKRENYYLLLQQETWRRNINNWNINNCRYSYDYYRISTSSQGSYDYYVFQYGFIRFIIKMKLDVLISNGDQINLSWQSIQGLKAEVKTDDFNKVVRNVEALKNISRHIDKVMNVRSLENVEKNWLCLKTTIDSVRWLTLQGCALRGHDESLTSKNRDI